MGTYLAVLPTPHFQLLHGADVIQFDQPIHTARGQPVAVGVPLDTIHLFLVRTNRAVKD